MSVRIYTSPGNSIFPRPTVLRQWEPGRVPRQTRYARSLSAPLGPDKDYASITYVPWGTGRSDFTTSLLLDSKRRDFVNDTLDTKHRELIIPLSQSKRRDFSSYNNRKDFTNSLLENKRRDATKNHLDSYRRDYTNSLLDNCRRDFTNSCLGNRRRDVTYNNLDSNRRDLTSSYLENKRSNVISNHFDDNRKALTSGHLEIKGKDVINNHLDKDPRDFTSTLLENKLRDVTNNELDGNRKDLANGRLTKDNNTKDSKNNHSDTKSSTLTETPRAIRWWNKDKKLCIPNDLLEIIVEPTGHYELPTDPCNEVYPGIILGDGPTALCTSMLKRMGVSHVLNAAQGKERPGQVNTSPSFYSHSRIRYLGIEAFDHIAFRLYPYFDEASDFIEDALDSGGKVLVHCRAGISRSATLVCAFLMLRRHQSVQDAVRTVRKNRPIIPNDGFLQQLCNLNERLQTRCP